MSKKDYWSYSLGGILLLGMFASPVFAEVTSLQTNDELFYIGDQIEFSGTVESGSIGLVTIVIRDLNNEFVQLTQAVINYDDSFEKSVKIENKFTKHGAYNATGFVLNMTKGVTTNFGISLNGAPITNNDKDAPNKVNPEILDNKEIIISEYGEEISESATNTNNADFVDPAKDPYHYVERYYSEPAYKSWFDRNYPGQTIEGAVGYTDNIHEIKTTVQEIIDKEIIPEAQASSIVEPIQKTKNSSDIAQISLAVVGLGILFGAVYGVKRQADNNARQISINKDTIRKRILSPILGLNPKEILQTRLAKGEITLEEYEKLRIKLN